MAIRSLTNVYLITIFTVFSVFFSISGTSNSFSKDKESKEKDFVDKNQLFHNPFPISEDVLCQSIPHKFQALEESREAFNKTWKTYHNSQLEITDPSDPIRLIFFQNLLEMANELEFDGAYGEFGTHRGFMAKVIWDFMDQSKFFYIFDTFEGFKKPDLLEEERIYASTWTEGNFTPTSVDMVRKYITNDNPPNLILHKGWFPDSFKEYEDIKWRFIHLDFDLYAPTKEGIEILWPKLVPGGIMVIHDYGCYAFPGVKKAVHEYFDPRGITPIPMPDKWGSVVIVKGK